MPKLTGVLIDRYEEEHYAIAITSAPHERLKDLLDDRGLGQADLARILKSRPLASEILSGRRAISKSQVKILAEAFRAPAELFL